jgi:hypothetical protein
MTQQSNVLSGWLPPLWGTHGAIRWLCTNNPFYVISAGLFLAGLWLSFGSIGATATIQDEETWALMFGMAGYTLLLAGTALLLVRYAGVWDDARTVLLLVVLMFLATSVTFDDVLVQNPDLGVACNLMGLGFALAVSETLLRGIRLQLPLWYRVPYYLILALFFLYPLALTPLVHEPTNELQMWGIFAFAGVAGVMFLTLLPAIRRGADYVVGNGSPWQWPLYPWALFGMLALAAPARAYLLCYSMHLVEGGPWDQLLIEPYFLVPFGLAAAVLLLEAGLTSRRQAVVFSALAMPLGLLALAAIGQREDPINVKFSHMFADRLAGSPLLVTVVASTAFIGYASLRGVVLARWLLAASLAGFTAYHPDWMQEALPLIIAAVLIAYGLFLRNWPVLTIACLMLGCWLITAGWQGYRVLRQLVVGLDFIVLSLAVFALALVISLGKSGILSKWLKWRRC